MKLSILIASLLVTLPTLAQTRGGYVDVSYEKMDGVYEISVPKQSTALLNDRDTVLAKGLENYRVNLESDGKGGFKVRFLGINNPGKPSQHYSKKSSSILPDWKPNTSETEGELVLNARAREITHAKVQTKDGIAYLVWMDSKGSVIQRLPMVEDQVKKEIKIFRDGQPGGGLIHQIFAIKKILDEKSGPRGDVRRDPAVRTDQCQVNPADLSELLKNISTILEDVELETDFQMDPADVAKCRRNLAAIAAQLSKQGAAQKAVAEEAKKTSEKVGAISKDAK